MKKRIFVSGATGAQGAAIANLLLQNGNEVATLSSQINIQKVDNLQVIPGNFEDIQSLKIALKNVKKAVFTFPLIFDIEKAKSLTANFINAAESEGVELVVFNASFDLPKSKTGLLALDLKLEIDNLLSSSNLNVITLIPDIYLNNLAAPWSIPLILEKGILPYPIQSEKKVPWISHSDLARYVAKALNLPKLAGKEFPIGGQMRSGEEIASAIGKHIGKLVNFIALTPDAFEEQLAPAFGELAAKEISNLYRYVDDNRSELIAKDFAKTHEALSIQPQSIEEWVASVKWN